MGFIRVREFADQCGCTPQNVYKHIRNYKEDLDGHVYQDRRGLMLDEVAQDFIRNVMYPKELSTDTTVANLQEEMAELRSAVMKLGQENLRMASELVHTQGERDRALFDLKHHQKLLQAAEDAEEAQKAEIEQITRAAAEAAQRAQDELTAAQKREDALREYAAALEAWSALGWLKRKRTPKPVMKED